MRHRNSVFHDILKLVPWSAFDRLVEAHGTDEGTRRFSSRQHLNALLFAQLSGAGSLREIGATMASHQGRLYHSGALAPKRSTLADANRSRDSRIFSGLFEGMLAQAGRGFRRKMADAVRLIDSTGLRLAGVGSEWARFSTGVFGAKAHVVYDPDFGRPLHHALTAANVNDITAAREMPIEAGATYVFDLGYYDFARWARLDALGCRLVRRFKARHAPERGPRPAACAGNTRAQRPDRLSAGPAGDEPQEPDAGRGPRDRRQDRDRPDFAVALQRSRRARRRTCSSLQAPLADRTVLPADEQTLRITNSSEDRKTPCASRSPSRSSPMGSSENIMRGCRASRGMRRIEARQSLASRRQRPSRRRCVRRSSAWAARRSLWLDRTF